MNLADKCIRLHEYCNGRYLLCLTESGNLYVFEQATMSPIFIRSITKPEKVRQISFQLNFVNSLLPGRENRGLRLH